MTTLYINPATLRASPTPLPGYVRYVRAEGSELYHRSMAYYAANEEDGGVLQKKVWGGTPWMVDAFTGSISDNLDREIREWCEKQFGREAWPIHGTPGAWHRGGATIFGWTWFGFETEDMMDKFSERWKCRSEANHHAAPCRHCGGDMLPGQAMASTVVCGDPDMGEVMTISAGGPGQIVSVSKCARCGWSVSAQNESEMKEAP